MTKIKKVFLLLVTAAVLLSVCIGAGISVYADTDNEEEIILPVESENEPATPDNADGEETGGQEQNKNIDALAAQFTEYLKDKYGEEYNYYYSLIIEKWGSVEGYLLAFGEKLPEESKSDWDKFVAGLRDYAPIWATPLAIAIVVVVAVVGKKQLDKIIQMIVNSKLSPVIKELNLQSGATVSLLRSQKALLGAVPKFADNVKELEQAEKELTDG